MHTASETARLLESLKLKLDNTRAKKLLWEVCCGCVGLRPYPETCFLLREAFLGPLKFATQIANCTSNKRPLYYEEFSVEKLLHKMIKSF